MKTSELNIGKYQRLEYIGGGAFGNVYKAHDVAIKQDRAIKIIPCDDPHKLIRQLEEAQLLEICKHAHIVEVKEADIYQIDGKDYVIISTELLKCSVAEYMKNNHISLAKSISFICDALFGLEHLHNHSIVHCDIKPGNLLIDDKGRAKLSDFGLAINLSLNQRLQKRYTLHAAPEIIKGSNADQSSDIYAMGVTLYRLVNNILCFNNVNLRTIKPQILKGQFPCRKSYETYAPIKIRKIINKAIHIDPQKRYKSVTHFRQALEKLVIAIDWSKKTKDEWEGKNRKNCYSIESVPCKKSFRVEFRRNSRRLKKLCKIDIHDNWKAQEYMNKVVADTSLE